MNHILLKLEQLGFSPYEAKAYYTLLRKHPANGYEISKIGRILAAKIYDTLNRLKLKGVIVESGTEAGRYYPVPPETFISKVRQDFSTMIGELEQELRETEPVADLDLTMNIAGYDALVDKMMAVVKGSHSSLWLSVWPEEVPLLSGPVAAAKQRGVTVTAAVFGAAAIECTFGVNLESCGVSARKRLGKRLTAVIADNREVVIGEIDENSAAEGVWTSTPAIVLVTKEYIKHDIWGHALIDILGLERFEELCSANPLLAYLLHNR